MKKIILFLLFVVPMFCVNAQTDGTIDNSFLSNNTGQKGVNGLVRTIAEQADGKLLIGGGFDTYNQILSPKLVRVNPDGSLDSSFNQTFLRDTNTPVTSIVIQPDGKILVAGGFEMRTPFPDNDLLEEDIMRLNADGTRDATFILPENTTGCGDIRTIALQPDGKILVAGDISFCVNSTIDNNENILRLNADGSLDSTFQITADNSDSAFDSVDAVAIQPDGKIIIAGNFNQVNGQPQSNIARINSDGTLDTSFTIGNGFNDDINDIALQSDGRIIIAGDFNEFNGATNNQIVRLNTDGTIDSSFDSGDGVGRFQPSNGFTAPRVIENINIQSDGKILIGGDYNRYNGNPVSRYTRLNSDGTLDSSFVNIDDVGIEIASVFTSLITSQGDFFIGGSIDKHNRYRKSGIVKLSPLGQVDLSFNSGYGPTEGYFSTKINIIKRGAGDKLYVGGRFREYDDVFSRNFARLNSDGSLDTSLSTGTDELINGFDDDVYDLVEQTDGKVIVVGDFENYNGNPAPGIIRLNNDGSVDATFNIGNGVNTSDSEVIRSIVVQSNGQLLVGGLFADFNGVVSRNFVRLNTDGSVDTSFDTGTGPNNVIHEIYLLNDEKIILNTVRYNEEVIPGSLVKINTNGSRDLSFDASDVSSSITEVVKMLNNGQLLIGGSYSSQGKLLKLNADGSLDNTFNTVNLDGGVARIYDIELQADGKIIIGGEFSTIDTRTIRGVARLNNDGTFDDTFNPTTTSDLETYGGIGESTLEVTTLELRDSGQLIIGGDFRSYNAQPKSPLIALFAGVPAESNPQIINIPDPNFEQALIDQNIDSDGLINGQILQTDALGVTSLILNNLNINDLTGVEAFIDLEILTAVNNNLTSLDITQNTALTSVILIANNLTGLDVSNNLNLSTLNLTSNAISTIDLANNTALTILNLQNNVLTNIDTSLLTNLSEFVVAQNSLTELDVSQNPNLIQIVCSQNDLTELNVQNGNNSAISGTFFDASNNPNLTCIQVDDIDYSTTNWFLFDSQSEFSINCNVTFINIPDPNFEQALIDLGIDSDGTINGQMLETDALGITSLDVNGENISDLTGIEFFTDLETLFAFNNNLSTIDVSQNLALTGLVLALNNLTVIDVSSNINLVSLSVNENDITEIDLSSNTALTQVFIENNQLASIDISGLPLLAQLSIAGNNIAELDASNNPVLDQLLAQNNNLVNLNIQNGNNTVIPDNFFDATGNPNLRCIQVDDTNYSNATWTNIDTDAFFGFDCPPINDGCTDAAPLGLGLTVTGSTFSASSSDVNPACQQNGIVIIDVWYEFVAPISGSITAVLSSDLNEVKIAVYEDCADTTPIACGTGGIQIDNLMQGETYLVQVWVEIGTGGRSADTRVGDFEITIEDTATLSIDDISDENKIGLFPNPASDSVVMSSSFKVDKISIFDLTGKQIYSQNRINSDNYNINTSQFSEGMYMIQITSELGIQTKKLIIKR